MEAKPGKGARNPPTLVMQAGLALGLLAVLISYYPVLAPLTDPSLQFAYGDFWSLHGNASAQARWAETFYTYYGGSSSLETNRFYPLAALSAFSVAVPFSDAQFLSFLILLSVFLGCIGIYSLALRYCGSGLLQALLLAALIAFYFLNLWSVERMGHIWIWYSYAVFPLSLALGLSYIETRKPSRLIAYSLVLSFFGLIPHAFLYLLGFHAFLIAYCIASGRGAGAVLALSLVPLAVYALICLPPLTLGQEAASGWVNGISSQSIDLLSRNGGLANLLAFSNNWWHQVPLARVYENPGFTYSSIAIFSAAFLALALAYGKLEHRAQLLAVFSAGFILALMFIAQGGNNALLQPVLKTIAQSDFSFLLRPFREWARISIMIPPLIVLTALICFRGLGGYAVLAFVALAALNVAFSPSWDYLMDVHAPMHIGSDMQQLKDAMGTEGKMLWGGVYGAQLPATTLWGKNTTTKTYLGYLAGIERQYQSQPLAAYNDYRGLTQAPEPLLRALGINDVVSMKRTGGYFSTPELYRYLDCGAIGEFMLCKDSAAPQPFRVYDGAYIIKTGGVEPAYHMPAGSFAFASEGDLAGVCCGEAEAGAVCAHCLRMHLLEAESDFKANFFARRSAFASNRSEALLTKRLSATVNITKAGRYAIALKGKGSFIAGLGNEALDLHDEGQGFAAGGPVLLEKGPAVIWAEPDGYGTSLDFIALYEEGAEGAQDIFSGAMPASGKVVGYRKISPAEWEASVDSQGPFLLSFAETHDSNWKADIYRDGMLVGTAEPLELYGAINGFWIEEAGSLTIRLRYAPQQNYERAIAISLLATIACVSMMVVQCAREGPDG